MIRSKYQITFKGGEKVDLLFSLSLFETARKMGVSLDLDADADIKARINYSLKFIYLGAVNAWELKQMLDPGIGEFKYDILDFAEWAAENRHEYEKLLKGGSEAISGQAMDVAEITDEEVKKK